MIGLGKKQYYNPDGTPDWLRTIVRTVYTFSRRKYHKVTDLQTMEEINHAEDTIFVYSIAARRARELYSKKTKMWCT